MSNEYLFTSRMEFRNWLIRNNSTSKGIWLILGKSKNVNTLSASEALEEALCFGWIDGIIKKIDETKYIKYFSPRRKESNWSEKNKKMAQELINKGLVTQSGLNAIQTAKLNGTWDAGINPTDYEELIGKFELLVKDNPEVYEKFSNAPLSYKKQMAAFYYDAKQENTKQKRFNKIVQVLMNAKKEILY